ncbi:MAG: 2-oxoacid:acceptor oxidoreductase family protein [Deltaproteobacteria bacterium]|jgi:2-oxoglutarate ferredoxin oxidoreductase subunit gamma|nr:2-oxoacid:acceptor oxidoreductase family protein [Deltaproteobacteria bacterium]
MNGNHYEMRFGGSGGQGMMLLGDILSLAAGCLEGKEILLTKSYGPESRGGACRSELVIDSSPINYPAVFRPDFVLAMTQLACDQYHQDLAPGGALLLDADLVPRPPAGQRNLYRLPLTRLARESTGKAITANMLALGAIAVLGRAAGVEAVRQAVRELLPARLLDINMIAFNAGLQAAEQLRPAGAPAERETARVHAA